MNSALRQGLSFSAAVALLGLALAVRADARLDDDEEDPAIVALKEVQDIVGKWDGLGAKSDKSANWEENLDVSWKFSKEGKAALVIAFGDLKNKEKGRLLDKGVLTYDAAKKKYLLSATKPGDAENALEFEGKRTKSGVLFERVKGKAKDELDKLEFKILNEGDRIVYNVQKRIGTGKAYKQVAQIGLNRQGTSIAAKEGNGPKCIVTGGAAAMTVSYEGQSYYVCCSGCREAFLANPAKYVAKAKKGD